MDPIKQLAAATNDLRDIKPPVEISNPWIWIAVVAAACLLAGGLWFVRRSLTQRKSVKARISVSPRRRAIVALNASLQYLDDPDHFVQLLSDAVRTYFDERFGLPATDRTTEEVLLELQAVGQFAPKIAEALEDFLQKCDLVKFAQYRPPEPELRAVLDAAVRLVEEADVDGAGRPVEQ